MAARKRTKFQREENYVQITALYLQWKTQKQMAAILGLSQGMISNDLKVIQRRWRESTTMNLDEAKAKELAKIDLLERDYQEWKDVYMAAWEASKMERTKSRQETDGKIGTDKKPNVKRASIEKEPRDGNPAFLDGLLKCNAGIDGCIDRRCKIVGLYAATKTQNLNVDLSTLTDEQLDRLEAGEPVEQVLKRG